MKRHTIKAGIIAAGALAAGCGTPDKPDIVLIYAEDMSTDLGCYGMAAARTPNLDRLASEGVMYTDARSTCPVSSPSRSAMMTGVHQTETGSHNHRSGQNTPLPEGIKPYVTYLRECGYTCVLGHEGCFETKGFLAADVHSSRKIDCNFKYEPTGPYDGKEHFGLFDRIYDTDVEGPVFQQITLYVTHRGDHWKSISSSFEDPTDPESVVLPSYIADTPETRKEFACYLDQVRYMDSEVGMILEKLRRPDNTIVIFMGDNGRCDVRAKAYLYEDGTKVPLIVWGRGIKRGKDDALASGLDIPATILHAAGIEIPEHFEGHVLSALGGRQKHEFLYTAEDNFDETIDCIRAVHDGRYTYIRNYMPERPYDQHNLFMDFYRPALHVMRRLHAEGKLTAAQAAFFSSSKPGEELYDCRCDRDCLENLAGREDMAETLGRMRALMDKWQAEHPDKGIEDRYKRKEDKKKLGPDNLRAFVQKNHPEEWEAIEAGEICERYAVYREEYKAALRATSSEGRHGIQR